MSIEIFPNDKTSVAQALALADPNEIEQIAIIFCKKDDPEERVYLVHSSMPIRDVVFFGEVMKRYAFES